MKIHKVSEILGELEHCINAKEPFSLIRWGDGGLKFIHAVLYNDRDQLKGIEYREGIPQELIPEIFELWGFYARRANYIDSPEVYFNNEFWPRLKRPPNVPMSGRTIERLKMWRELYSRAEFDNNKFCNPEINYLMILRMERKQNLLDTMIGKKIRFITDRPEIISKFDNCEVDAVEIVGQYQKHYQRSFQKVSSIIKRHANSYDFWLVAAGELGRIYTGLIKQMGGRAIDIGFVVDYWMDEIIPIRMQPFVDVDKENHMELILRQKALKYRKFI